MNLADALLATATTDPSSVALTGSSPLTYGELLGHAAAVQARVRPGLTLPSSLVPSRSFSLRISACSRRGCGGAVERGGTFGRRAHRELRSSRDPALVLASELHGDLGAQHAVMQGGTEVPVVTLGTETANAEWVAFTRTFRSRCVSPRVPRCAQAGDAHARLAPRESRTDVQSHPGLRLRETDVALGTSCRCFHVYGLNVVVGLTLIQGARFALVDHFHPRENVARVPTTGHGVAGVPAVYDAWLGLDEADRGARVVICECATVRFRRHVAQRADGEWFPEALRRADPQRVRPDGGIAGCDDDGRGAHASPRFGRAAVARYRSAAARRRGHRRTAA